MENLTKYTNQELLHDFFLSYWCEDVALNEDSEFQSEQDYWIDYSKNCSARIPGLISALNELINSENPVAPILGEETNYSRFEDNGEEYSRQWLTTIRDFMQDYLDSHQIQPQ